MSTNNGYVVVTYHGFVAGIYESPITNSSSVRKIAGTYICGVTWKYYNFLMLQY